MLRIEPKSQLEAFKSDFLLDEGNYEFTIKEINEKVSKSSGNPMLEVIFEAFGKDGAVSTVYDYIIEGNNKIYKLLYATDNGAMAQSGQVDLKKLVNSGGHFKLAISYDATGRYKPKNVVSEYLLNVEKESNNEDVFSDSDLNKDIQF